MRNNIGTGSLAQGCTTCLACTVALIPPLQGNETKQKNYRFWTDPVTNTRSHPEKSPANKEVTAFQARTTDLAVQQNGCFLLSFGFHPLSCELKSQGHLTRALFLRRRQENQTSRAHTSGSKKEQPRSGTHWHGQKEKAAVCFLVRGGLHQKVTLKIFLWICGVYYICYERS